MVDQALAPAQEGCHTTCRQFVPRTMEYLEALVANARQTLLESGRCRDLA